jgi:hypothetical protein
MTLVGMQVVVEETSMTMNEDYIPAFRNNLRYNPTNQVDDY